MKNYRSELVGAFGNPIDENPTGVMEEAAFAAAGLNWRYLTVRVEKQNLAAAMAGVRAFGMRGVNLTIPHKVAVLSYLDELSEAAAIIGAVNVVVHRNGRLWGDNTDGKGFLSALGDAGVAVAGKTITVLGAGGASRAICVECALAGARRLHIANIEAGQGQELATLVNEKTPAEAHFHLWQGPFTPPMGTDILVNATSVGLYPHCEQQPDLDYNAITPGMAVSDVIFNDPNSLFLQQAARRGAQTVNGLGMLARQGALNFRLWTGQEAPLAVMEETLRREFALE